MLGKKQLHQARNHLSAIYPRTLITLQHMLLLTKNKKKLSAFVSNNCKVCDYLYSLAYIAMLFNYLSYITALAYLRTEKTHAK